MAAKEQRCVLVVGEEDSLGGTLLEALRCKPLEIDRASGAPEALSMLQENCYAVVLLHPIALDEGTPLLDAIERTDDDGPVVLVIGGTDRSLAHRMHANRIHGIIRDPFDVHDIAEVVDACADLRGRRSVRNAGLDTRPPLPC